MSLESLLLQIVGDAYMAVGFSALLEASVVPVGLHNVCKTCWGFPKDGKQKVPKETRIHQTKRIHYSSSLGAFQVV